MTDGPGEPDLWASTGNPSDADAAHASAVPPPPPSGAGPAAGDTTRARPSWLMPAVLGLVIGLVVAVVAVVLTRDGDGEIATGATTPVDTAPEVAPTDPAPDTEPPAAADPTSVPATDAPPSTDEPSPSTTELFLPPSSAPATTAAPAAPASTDAPAADDGVIEPADDGFVRVGGNQFPVERTCVTRPFEPNNAEFVVFSYLFRNEAGIPQIADHWFDGAGVTGGSYSDGGRAVDVGYEFLGVDEFALTRRTEGGDTRIIVNPPADGATDCGGRMITNDVETPDFPYQRSIVDVCFGSQVGPLQYVAYLSEGGAFTAAPNGDGTMALHAVEPFVNGYVNPAATSVTLDGNVEIRGRASGSGFTGPVTKDFVITIDSAATRDCTATDVPFPS